MHISEAIVSEIYDTNMLQERKIHQNINTSILPSLSHTKIFIYLFIHEQVSELQRLDISVNIQSMPMNNYERVWCRTTNTEDIEPVNLIRQKGKFIMKTKFQY